MVVRFDGVHHHGIHAIAPAELRAQLGVRPVLVMVHGFADIVQEAALLGKLHIGTDLRRQDARQLGYFHGVGKLVLSIGGPEFQAAHHAHHFGMQAGDVGIVGGLLARFVDDLFHSPGFILDDFFNVCGMDPAIQDQFCQGAPANLTPDRVEARDRDGVRGIVHDHVHAGRLLKGFDVATVASDDASLHLFIGEGDHSPRDLGHMLGGNPLDGIRDQLAGALFTLLTRLRFDLADDARHVAAGFLFHGGKEFFPGIVGGHLRDEFQLLDLFFMQLIDLIARADPPGIDVC